VFKRSIEDGKKENDLLQRKLTAL
jgi:predicted RNase H-like nuclease (RuvC/YqgF family)